jgi:hypothetical protein
MIEWRFIVSISNVSGSEESVLVENSFSNFIKNSMHGSAVSWGAILAGAAAAAALSLILLLLGAGLGLSSVSPWVHKGISAGAFGVSAIIWLTVTQILASGMGGFLTGRLRSRWAAVQADEVYFRDTAHGFLAWAVATLTTAILLTSVIGAIVSGGTQVAASLAGGATSAAFATTVKDNSSSNATNLTTNELEYFVDTLFRADIPLTSTESNVSSTDFSQQSTSNQEVTRIILNSLGANAMPPADVTRVGQLISKRTGLGQQEAEIRVNEVFISMQKKLADAELAAKNAAEKARKASIYASLWLFASLLMGAFSASLAATWGGRCRDT